MDKAQGMDKYSGILRVNNLLLWAHHGWYEEERLLGGKYQIDVELELHPLDAFPDLSDVVNYEEVCKLCRNVMQQLHLLIEHSSNAIVLAIETRWPNIRKIQVTVTKHSLPINNVSSTSYTSIRE
ncbi:MAG: dihydroneopterin aldolase [Bacteroidia bacterium]|jgi:dihydroneopterin aldolase